MLVKLCADVKQRLTGATELFTGDTLIQFLPQYTLTLLQQVQVIPARESNQRTFKQLLRVLLILYCYLQIISTCKPYLFRQCRHFLLYYFAITKQGVSIVPSDLLINNHINAEMTSHVKIKYLENII